jgi:penicillin-binding protein 1A
MASAPKEPSRKRKVPFWFWLFFGFLVIVFVAIGSGAGILLGYEYNLPQIQSLEDYRPDVITDVYSDDNKIIGEFAIERRIIVSYNEIPPYLQLAILAAEDDQFYNHSGINYFSDVRAVYKGIVKRRLPEGTSTITQQLARMLIGSYEKTLDRKIKELLIAWKIEKRYSKQQILTLYCNQHNMGRGVYGVAAAAETYFGKQLKDLTLEECAMIAGLPSNPTLYSPLLHPKAALRRRNWVLDRMVFEHMISQQLAAEAKSKPLVVKPVTHDDTALAPHFLEWVRESLAARYSTDEIWRKGLQVYTTLNIRMQKAAYDALHEGLRKYDKSRGWRGPLGSIFRSGASTLEGFTSPAWRNPLHPEQVVVGLVEDSGSTEATVKIGKYEAHLGLKDIAWTKAKSPAEILRPGDTAYFKILSLDDVHNTASVSLDQQPAVEGAILVIQNSTGEIKAMVGGYDFGSSEFNRATQAMRQVGSTFKPLVYSSAFERGLTPDSTVVDAPISFTDALGRVYQPHNYDGKFKGQISVRQALAESRNVPTIKVASLIGIKNVVVMARRFGLSGPMEPYLPLALGACEATLLEMASAFAVFPNLGVQAKPYFIRRVEDYDRVKKEETTPQVHQVLKPEIAQQMLGLLQNVVQNGTATAAKSLGRPLGGKTGTTDNFTDAWFIGFTPSLTAAVWIGFDEKKSLGEKESGAVVALPIWIECMREILKDKPVENFPSVESTDQFSNASPESEKKPLYIENLPGNR